MQNNTKHFNLCKIHTIVYRNLSNNFIELNVNVFY